MKSIILLIVVIISLVNSQSIALQECIFEKDNFKIDLSPLKGISINASFADPVHGTFKYYASLCSTNQYCSNNVTYIASTQSCQTLLNTNYVIGSIGYGSYMFYSNDSLEIRYNNSKEQSKTDVICSNGAYRSSTYQLICDRDVDYVLDSYYSSSTCLYQFTIRSKYACKIFISPTPQPTTPQPTTPQPTNCIYNGVDYSNLYNSSGYSAYSSVSGVNQAGKYKFYWNVCGGLPSKCGSGVSACMEKIDLSSAPTTVGLVSLGSFSNVNGVELKYNTNTSPCGGGMFRSFNIQLVCNYGPLVVSNVAEESKCQYNVTMSGLAACGNQYPVTPAPTTQPPVTSTPTPTGQPKITCELLNNELKINSTSPIKCVGIGKTFCNIGSDATCSTDEIDGSITCAKGATVYSPSSISCIGNTIKCNSLYVQCSVGTQSSNLIVNDRVIQSNIFDSTNTDITPAPQTPEENEKLNEQPSNSSTLSIFKNIIISILIVSSTMLLL